MKHTVVNFPVANFDEIILFLTDRPGEQFAYRQLFQKYNELSALVDDQYDCDEIEDIIRIDVETGRSVSLAEEVAQSWVDNHNDRLTPETIIPRFVEKSDAWEAFVSEWKKQAYEDARYGTYKQQNSLHPSQIL